MFALCATKKNKYANSRVVRKKILNETKNHNPEFLRKIDNFDLLFLVETHLGPDHNISNIGSYYCNLICRPKKKANNRYFGGLAILCKQSIKPHIKIM